MKLLVYSAKNFEIPFLDKAKPAGISVSYTNEALNSEMAMKAIGFDAISIFSADDASVEVLEKLSDFGVQYISLRSAGHDNINSTVANSLGIKVANAPDYSPNSIAEHAITLLMALNRKIVQANQQVKENNFSLDNLVGFDLKDKTVGIMGTGRIGSIIARILCGFQCSVLANDYFIDKELQTTYKVEYVSKSNLQKKADILILSIPLTTETYHLIDQDFLQKIEKKPILVNVSRGAIVKTDAVINALDDKKLSGYATDVYEKERAIFFKNHSSKKMTDQLLEQLINHPNVLLTPHQAFVTQEAIENIATTTFSNLKAWQEGKVCKNELH